jgi:hypothetical protein
MSQANVPLLGFSSEPCYDVVYKGDCEEILMLDTECVYLSEICENCAQYEIRAELWSPGFIEIDGFVSTTGAYRLIHA